MKTRALGFLLMVAAAGVYGIGCGSSDNKGGTGGAGGGTSDAGTGGKGTGGMGTAGMGAGGSGTGGKVMDAGGDTKTDTAADMAMDTPAGDTQTAPTFTQVFAILSDKSTATSPNCAFCHDGIIPDGGQVRLPHSMNLADKAAAYAALVGVASQRCAGSDAGADASPALMRVQANNSAQSVLWQKVNQFVNPAQLACDSVAMPLNPSTPLDGGSVDGSAVDGGFTMTHYAIDAAQVTMIMGWINAGALNN